MLLELGSRNGCIPEVASADITEELADELEELSAMDQKCLAEALIPS